MHVVVIPETEGACVAARTESARIESTRKELVVLQAPVPAKGKKKQTARVQEQQQRN
jgi:hypothetical protein